MQQTTGTSVRQWDLMGYEERHDLIATSTDAEIAALADAVAAAGRRSRREVLRAWVQFGYLSADRAAQIQEVRRG